ncbi:MAG: Rieske 2Fe-2S domain-containing protein [Acidimicrobiia bacterium]|nr:Rieske 2Fe-2S domain-containing protein [Acidimicrobiia bacterium]
MLSQEANERLTRSGPGTQMGELFRRFWLPVALASEVGGPAAGPARVHVLGQPFVAFRNDDGTVGLVDAACPHRLANLFWGRNEGDGLRCVYHGWKFTADGRCTEQPAEPRPFCDRVRVGAHPVREAAGLLWAYLGPAAEEPPFPRFEFTELPASHVYASKRLQRCNWMQNLEGEIDSAHVQQLHQHAVQRIVGGPRMAPPRYQIEPSPAGLLAMAVREVPDEPEREYWRVTPYLMPSFTLIPMPSGEPQHFTGAIPRDDLTMWGFTVTWHPDRPLTGEELRVCREDDYLHVRVDPDTFVPLVNHLTDYDIDRAAQAAGSMTGIPGLRTQDLAVQEDQAGPLTPRHREQLGSTDRAIVATRRLLLDTAEALSAGVAPSQPHAAGAYRCRSVAVATARGTGWAEVVRGAQPEGGGLVPADADAADATDTADAAAG